MYSKKKIIIDKALNYGFDIVKFTTPTIFAKDKNYLKQFIQKNYYGDMHWLKRHFEKKINPKNLWNQAQTIIILGTNYAPKKNPLLLSQYKIKGNISVYAQGIDYHEVIKKKLKRLQNFINQHFCCESRFYVDTSPVFEKSLAQKAGLGWHGKHTNIVSKKFGSWLFLSELFLPFKLTPDKKEMDHCGSCNDCLKICPTNAFVNEYELDARKCISYLTIEHKGPFPISLRKKIGNKIYGCDDCLSVCPWNKFSKPTTIDDLMSKRNNNDLDFFLKLSEKKFSSYFQNSPIKRIGWDKFMRNVLIATGNSKNRNLIKYIFPFLTSSIPLLRGTALWTLGELSSKKLKESIKKKYFDQEKNSYVLFEWKYFNKK